MKITLFSCVFLLSSLLSYCQLSSGDKISVKEALTRLSRDYGVQISYVDDSAFYQQVLFNGQSKNLRKEIKYLIDQTDFVSREQADGSFIIMLSESPKRRKTTYYNIKGTITDESRAPISYANVYFENTTIGTYSNDLGEFILSRVPSGKSHELVVSSINYETSSQLIRENPSGPLLIELREKFHELEGIEITPGLYELNELKALQEYTLQKEQIDLSPNLIQDVFRTINQIPSVANTDFSVKPRIRGGNFDETAIYLDGFELINPFHIEISGGVEGLFNTEYVDNIKVLPGSFSTQYTDKLSGIVDLSSSNYAEKKELTLSLDLLNAIASTQLNIGEKLKFFSNFRRGYWDVLLDLDALGASLKFYDTWNKLVYQPNQNNVLEFSFLYGKDKFNYSNTEQNIEIMNYNSDFDKTYAWINWKAFIKPTFFVRTTTGFQSLSRASDFIFESTVLPSNNDNAKINVFSLNQYFENEFNDKSHLSFGVEYRYFTNQTVFRESRYNVHESTVTLPVIENFDIDAQLDGHLYGFYTEYTQQFSSKFSGKGGVRLSGQTFSNSPNIAPRVNFKYKINENLETGLGYGWFYQPDNYFDLRSEIGQSELNKENGKSVHYTGSVNLNLKKSALNLNLYYKDNERLNNDFRFMPTNRIESFKTFEENFGMTSGSSSGVEISFNHFYGSHAINVVYAFTRNRMRNADGEETSRDLDIPHYFSIGNIWKFKSHFVISTSFIIRSGFPRTSVNSVEGIPIQNNLNEVIFYKLNSKNTSRYKAYKTFDLKFSKNWYGKKTKWEAYLNFLNLLNFENIRNFYFDGFINNAGDVNVSQKENSFFPFFVTPGVKVTF